MELYKERGVNVGILERNQWSFRKGEEGRNTGRGTNG
jgi:hypothetical protein